MNLNAKLQNIYHKHPGWAISLYYNLPIYFQNIIRDKIRELEPTRPVEHLTELTFLPLDPAWAEVVFAPFHDPMISPTLPLEYHPLKARGCKIDFSWCWTILSWESCPEYEEAVVLTLNSQIKLLHYDRLIICLAIPKTIRLSIEIEQNGHWQESKEEHQGTGSRMEINLPLNKGVLNQIKLHFRPETPLAQNVQLSWFGLQDSAFTKSMTKHRLQHNPNWTGLLKPVDKWGPIEFELNLLFDNKEIKKLREKKKLPCWDRHFQLLEKKAHEYLKRQPEKDLGEYLPLDDRRYLREDETGKKPYYFEALVLGFVGLINNDSKMIVHALRYLMCMVHTKKWTQSGESRLTGSTWDQRCFLEEMTTSSVCLLSDWFSFALTARAKDLICQSIWDKGLSIIERDMMKYEYLYSINQGAVFCRARILGGLYLEKFWLRTGKYVDRAYGDMFHCLKNYIEKDGGTPEGIGYFCQTLQAVLPATIAYAISRKKNLENIIKKQFAKCENYIAAMSGSIPGTAIMEGDCRTDYFSGDCIPILARFFPGGKSEKILGACIETGSLFAVTGTLSNSGGITGFVYGPDRVVNSECIVPTFTILHKSGHLASFRKEHGQSVRIHLIGSKANASHSHFDKGSIVLEVDNEQVLVDRGMVNYYFSEAYELKRSALHNVITPLLTDGTYPDQKHPTKPLIPRGRGDNLTLKAEINLSDVWQDHMTNCSRSVLSKTPDKFLITDEGELKQKGKLAFHIHSTFPIEIEDKRMKIRGNNKDLLINALWSDKIICRRESINLRHEPVNHIIIHSPPTKEFVLETRIEIISKF